MRRNGLAIASATTAGLLAGATVDRLAVQLPAFQRTGVRAWADFSRNADLSINGAVVYPLEAIVSAGMLIGAAVLSRRSSFIVAAVLSTLGLATTIKAAPHMLRVRKLRSDAKALTEAYDGFRFWSSIRGAFHIAAFVAAVWALNDLQPRAE